MDGNTNGKQFGMILASVLVTLAISLVVGVLNGASLNSLWLHIIEYKAPNVCFLQLFNLDGICI